MPSAVGRCLLAAAVLLAAAGALAAIVALPEPACGFQTELTAYFINEPVTYPTSNAISVSFWVKLRPTLPEGVSTGSVYAFRTLATLNIAVTVTVSNQSPPSATLAMFIDDNFLSTLGPQDSWLNDGGWHNVVVAIDYVGQSATLYVDGNLWSAAVFAGAAFPSADGSLSIGAVPSGYPWDETDVPIMPADAVTIGEVEHFFTLATADDVACLAATPGWPHACDIRAGNGVGRFAFSEEIVNPLLMPSLGTTQKLHAVGTEVAVAPGSTCTVPSPSSTPSPTVSPTPTVSNSPTSSLSMSPSPTVSDSPTGTPTSSTSMSSTTSPSPTVSDTPSNSNTPSTSVSLSSSPSLTASPSDSNTPTVSTTPSVTPSISVTPDPTPSDLPKTWQTSSWTECSEACGGGIRQRLVSCHNDRGAAVDAQLCPSPAPISTENCNTQNCPTVYWGVPGPWSACSKQCLDGPSDTPGESSRTGAPCMQGITEVAKSTCAAAGLPEPPTTMQCNTQLCPSAVRLWSVGEWGPCVSIRNCGAGIRTRAVTCVDALGAPLSDLSCTAFGFTMPTETQECSMTQSCPCAVGADCSDVGEHMVCRVGSCVCSAGWAGPQCNVPTFGTAAADGDTCSDGVFLADGQCCRSLVDGVTGECCDPSVTVLDANERCCDGVLDPCGVCNGAGVALAIDGSCCQTPLTAAGTCCSTYIDSCGVCGGLSECLAKVSVRVQQTDTAVTAAQLAQAVATSLQLPLSSVERAVVAEITDDGRRLHDSAHTDGLDAVAEVQPRGLQVVTEAEFTFQVPADAAVGNERLVGALSAGASLLPGLLVNSDPIVDREPFCGDRRCENGETCADTACVDGCFADCPVIVRRCPGTPQCSGAGGCNAMTAACQCFSGFTGDMCERCDEGAGYLPIGGRCVLMPGSRVSCADGVRNGEEEGVDCGGPHCSTCSKVSMIALLKPMLIGAAGFLVVVGVILAVRRSQKKKQASNTMVAPSAPSVVMPTQTGHHRRASTTAKTWLI